MDDSEVEEEEVAAGGNCGDGDEGRRETTRTE